MWSKIFVWICSNKTYLIFLQSGFRFCLFHILSEYLLRYHWQNYKKNLWIVYRVYFEILRLPPDWHLKMDGRQYGQNVVNVTTKMKTLVCKSVQWWKICITEIRVKENCFVFRFWSLKYLIWKTSFGVDDIVEYILPVCRKDKSGNQNGGK